MSILQTTFAMKEKRYADIESIQKASTAILKDISKVELKIHSTCYLTVQNVVLKPRVATLNEIITFF